MALAELVILHTNDLHSRLEVWPRVAALVRRGQAAAAAAGHPALYLDAGDHMDVSELTCYATGGRVNRELLAAAGCRAFTPGNNEIFRQSAGDLQWLAHRSPFPWLAANLRAPDGSRLRGLSDWVLLSAGPIRVGIFGLTVPVPPQLAQLGYASLPPEDAARRCAAELRAAGAHLVVLLSHSGLREDRTLAAAGPGADVIIGGHSHDALDPAVTEAGVPIAMAGEYGQYVGRLRLTVDLAARRLAAWDSRLLTAADPGLAPDPGAEAILAGAGAERDAALSEVLAVLPRPLGHSMTGPSDLGPVMAECVRRFWDADIGLVVGGQALHGLPAGPVTRGDVMAACPALMIPGLLELQGSTLVQLLEESEDPQRHGEFVAGAGLRGDGAVVGRVFTAGVSYRVDAAAPPGQRIRDVRVGGEPLDPGRVYRAGSPTLLGFTESGYSAAAGIRIVRRAMPELVRDVFMHGLRRGWV